MEEYMQRRLEIYKVNEDPKSLNYFTSEKKKLVPWYF